MRAGLSLSALASAGLFLPLLWGGHAHGEGLSRSAWPLGLELESAAGAGAPLSEDAVRLGRRLFFDASFSRDRSVSCASCHRPEQAFASNARLSAGVSGALGTRNAPSLVNRLLGRSHFWDGRAADLESQALGPLFAPAEMAMDEELVLRRLAEGGYADDFRTAFDQPPSLALFARALASFERTLLSGEAPFDRYEWLGEAEAIGAEAKRGLALFRGKARCTLCHTGTNFTDELYHDVGTGGDRDRGRQAVTGAEADARSFKTPTLRNVALTRPYMHDGSLDTLEAVVEHYDRGGAELVPLRLSAEEKRALVAFLASLTGPIRSVWVADLEQRLEAAR